MQEIVRIWRGRLRVFLDLGKPPDHRLDALVGIVIALLRDHLPNVTHLRVHLSEFFAYQLFEALAGPAPMLINCAVRVYKLSDLHSLIPEEAMHERWFQQRSTMNEDPFRPLTYLELENVALLLLTNDALLNVRTLGLEGVRILHRMDGRSDTTYTFDRITCDTIFALCPNVRRLIVCPKVYSCLTHECVDCRVGLVESIHIRGDGDLGPCCRSWMARELILDLDDFASPTFGRKARSIMPLLSNIPKREALYLSVRPNQLKIALTWRELATGKTRIFYARATSSFFRGALRGAFSEAGDYFSSVVTLVLHTACFSVLSDLVVEMPRVSALTIYWTTGDAVWFRESQDFSESVVNVSSLVGVIRFRGLTNLLLASTIYPTRRIRAEDVVTILESNVLCTDGIMVDLHGLVLMGVLDDVALVRALRTHAYYVDPHQEEVHWKPRGELEDYIDDVDLVE